MERYSKINVKCPREIVLLKGRPCAYGACTFCTYLSDNTTDDAVADECNMTVLDQITGEFSALEVINSGSVFELPPATLERIEAMVREREIHHVTFESHWMYHELIAALRRRFAPIELRIKCGVETFDVEFRERVLNKGMDFELVGDFKTAGFDSPCLMVCMQGQTRRMIEHDMDIALGDFTHATVSMFTNNGSPIVRDEQLAAWFRREYAFLDNAPNIEMLWRNTDFGVGD